MEHIVQWFGAEMHLLQMVYHIGSPGSLTKLVEMPVWRRSGTHQSQTGHCPATNCCLGHCWTLFSPYNTKGSRIIPYSTQKTQSGPLLRVAHYLTWYSSHSSHQEVTLSLPCPLPSCELGLIILTYTTCHFFQLTVFCVQPFPHHFFTHKCTSSLKCYISPNSW